MAEQTKFVCVLCDKIADSYEGLCLPIPIADTFFVLIVLGFAGGAPCTFINQFLHSFDFEADNGIGYGTFTDDLSQAMKFQTSEAAIAFWQTQSKTKPIRADGRPNRPLTCTAFAVAQGVTGYDNSRGNTSEVQSFTGNAPSSGKSH